MIRLEHLSEVQRRALAIADNQLALNAGWDEQMLRQQLAALKDADFDLDLLGFDDSELARQLANEQAARLAGEDEVPAIPISPVNPATSGYCDPTKGDCIGCCAARPLRPKMRRACWRNNGLLF